jgi:hypothetical protein
VHLISAEWVGILVAIILGIANLAVTLGLDRRRQHERAVERQAREAHATFEQDVRAPLRNSLQELETLSARILQAAGQTVASERQQAARDIFENHKTQVLAAFDRPLESARHWSSEGHDHYIRRLRDLELQMDSTLRELAVGDFATTQGISASARRLADLVHEFSTACRLWLSEISEPLSSGKLQPPRANQSEAGARSRNGAP